MQNVVQRIKRERRAGKVREACAFIASMLGILAVLAVLWVMLWVGCALSDVCYYANI